MDTQQTKLILKINGNTLFATLLQSSIYQNLLPKLKIQTTTKTQKITAPTIKIALHTFFLKKMPTSRTLGLRIALLCYPRYFATQGTVDVRNGNHF
jgi:hypothetical protein